MQRMDYHFKITFSIKLETLTFPLLPVLGAAAVSIGIRGSCFLTLWLIIQIQLENLYL